MQLLHAVHDDAARATGDGRLQLFTRFAGAVQRYAIGREAGAFGERQLPERTDVDANGRLRQMAEQARANEIQLQKEVEAREKVTQASVLLSHGATEQAVAASNRQIADELQVSEATVKTHFEHIYKKLEVHDRATAVGEALRQGLIE